MDPQHLAIMYASVKLTSVATAEERKVTANAHGVYEIGPLLPELIFWWQKAKGLRWRSVRCNLRWASR